MKLFDDVSDARSVSVEVLESQLNWYVQTYVFSQEQGMVSVSDPCIASLRQWVMQVNLTDLFNYHMDMMGYDALVITPLPKAA